MVDLLGFGACLRWWFFRKSFCCRRQCSPPPTHTAYQNFLVPPPPVDMAAVLMVSTSYHRGIIWTRYMGGGFTWDDQGSVLLWIRGRGLTVICRFCWYLHPHHRNCGCQIIRLLISVCPIPHHHGGLYFTYNYHHNNSIFDTVVVIGNIVIVVIVIDIFIIIFLILIFAVIHSHGRQYQKRNQNLLLSFKISIMYLTNTSSISVHKQNRSVVSK